MYRPAYELLPGWQNAFERAVASLERYRVGDGFDRAERLARWLSNFDGPRDQGIALTAAATLVVIDPVAGTEALLERIRKEFEEFGEPYHTTLETSGGLLLRILEKELRVRGRFILSLEDVGRVAEGHPPPRLERPGTLAHWDTVYGSGSQHQKAMGSLEPRFPRHRILGCYLLAPANEEVPEEVRVAWRAPRCGQDLLDLNDRYSPQAEPDAKRRARLLGYQRDMLATPPDNAPNNLPLVLWVREHEGWATLLDRRETALP
jgi:hypothetical protein